MASSCEPLQPIRFVERLSQESRHRREYDLDKILDALASGRPLVDVAKDYGMVSNAAEEAFLRSHWYNEDGNGWWKDWPVQEIMRAGVVRALELMRTLDLPIDAYWAPGGDRFAVSIAVSPKVGERDREGVILMILHTPPTPPDASIVEGDLVDDENISIIEADKDGNVVTRPCRRPR